MKKTFYICDSFETNGIAKRLKDAFPDSTMYTDSSVFSAGVTPSQSLMNVGLKLITEKQLKKDGVNEKIDFFILSAKLIFDGSIKPSQLKAELGASDSRLIAFSSSSFFLNQISDLVDFTGFKYILDDELKIKKFFSKI